MVHKEVLSNELISGLQPQKGQVIVDCTLGNGGHSLAICKETEGQSTIIAFDKDEDSIKRAKIKLCDCSSKIIYINDNFANVSEVLDSLKIESVDCFIFDLGFSSDQIEESGRGFSFNKDEPLLMTYQKNPSKDLVTAYDVVNFWEAKNLESILKGFGEERYSSRIVNAIEKARAEEPIKTTSQLVRIIKEAVPKKYHYGKIHPATRTFQAIRIAVNDEMGSLKKGLVGAFNKLNAGGRMAVISFHSLEDRMVKEFYREKQKEELATIITKKPITPSIEELQNNPRARSAKLRILKNNDK